MIYSILILVLTIFPLSFGFAQPNKSPETKEGQLIEISDMCTDCAEGQCGGPDELGEGIIKKRKFLSDEITIKGFVLMYPDDERIYINIDTEFLKKKDMWERSWYPALMKKGNKVKVWVYGRGAKCNVLWADKIKLEK